MKNKRWVYVLFLLSALPFLAGIASAGVISDREYHFQMTIPDSWHVNSFMEGVDKVWAFVAPDKNAAIRVRCFEVPPRTTIDQVRAAYESRILGGWQRLTLAPYTLNGITGQMAGYRGQFNDIDMGAGCFYAVRGRYAYILWSMIPVTLFKARTRETDAILNTFTLTSSPRHQRRPERARVNIFDIQTGDALSGSYGLASVKSRFAPSTPNIYVVFKYEGRPYPDPFIVKWIYRDRNYVIDTATLNVPNTDGGMAKTYMNRPNNGWPPGDYDVEIHHRGHKLTSVAFSVIEKRRHEARCRQLGEVSTDGRGNKQKKRVGGTYLAIPKADLGPSSSININVVSGSFSYVTVHARYDGGYWKTAYQGPLMRFPVEQYFQSFLNQPQCTHLIVSVNGAHERYEPIVCRATVSICP